MFLDLREKDRQVFNRLKHKGTLVWGEILTRDPDLEKRLTAATGWSREQLPQKLQELYKKLSGQVHEHFKGHESRVRVDHSSDD